MRSSLALLVLGLCSIASAIPGSGRRQDGHGNGGGGGGGEPEPGDPDNSSAATGTPTPTASGATASAAAGSGSAASEALIGMNGDVVCTDLLCVGGLVNGSTIQYTLQSLNAAPLGWMAMGFGGTMAGSPMVIMWPNTDGSITLSQRKTSAEVMPTVDPSPPRPATLETSLSSLTGSNPKLVYTIPSNGATSQSIIWAFGATNPKSSAVDATLVQHLNSGPTSLDLSKTVSSTSKDPTNPIFAIGQASSGNSSGSSGSNGSNSGSSGSFSFPLLPFEKMIVAHGILSVIGFLFVLPAGALFARFLRTFTNRWFKGHWIIQFALAGPIIIAAFACACSAVSTAGSPGFNDTHKKVGLAIFVLYLVQISLGGFIHYIKPKSFTVDRKRPIQNYGHAVLGLAIIVLAFYQVRTGFKTEWFLTTGRSPVGNGANIVWYIWVVVIPLAYIGGLFLLPRQFKQERGVAKPANAYDSSSESEAMNMSTRGEYRDAPQVQRY